MIRVAIRVQVAILLPLLLSAAGLGGCAQPVEGDGPRATIGRIRPATMPPRAAALRREAAARTATRAGATQQAGRAPSGEPGSAAPVPQRENGSQEATEAANPGTATVANASDAAGGVGMVPSATRRRPDIGGDGGGGRWRVRADGTVGCALPGPLPAARGELPRNAGLSAAMRRRAIAEAFDEGRCLTTFRVNEWALLRMEGDRVQLRLTRPEPASGNSPVELWFLRRDLLEPTSTGHSSGAPSGTGGERSHLADTGGERH